MMKRILYLIVVAILFCSTMLAGETIECYKTDTPPKIDGKLDDAVWQKARGYSNFISFMPEYGVPARQKTLAYVAYDKDNLYFGFKCFDKEPEKIIATYYQRDKSSRDDKVGLFLDSHNDGQNAYFLLSNPYGIQSDAILMSNGSSDKSQDFVWQSAGVRHENGYSVEIRLPLQSIRFKNADIVTMRLGFWRRISRYSEQYAFPEWKAGKGSFVSQLGLAKFEGIKYKRVFEVLPSVTYTNRKLRDDEQKLITSDEKKFQVGLTTKLGVTSDLTLDVAVNPDFSHIESDADQVDVNLRNDIIYEEKRPFFLEGLEHFNFAGTGGTTPIELIVNTRKIKNPELGLKLSGKTGKAGIVNSIFAIDKELDGSSKNYFGVFRYKHLIKDDSYIGGIYTGKEFRPDGTGSGETSGYLHSGGIDSRIRINGFLYLDTFYLHSFKKDSKNEDSIDGNAFGGTLAYESDTYLANLSYHDLGKNFDLDPGHLYRTSYRALSTYIERNFYFSSNFLKRAILGYSGVLGRDKDYSMNEYNHTLFTEWIFPSNSHMYASYNIGTEVFKGHSFKVNRFLISGQSQPIRQFFFKAAFSTGGSPFYGEATQADLKTFSGSVLFQPTSKFSSEFKLTWHILNDRASGNEVFNIQIYRNKTVYQINKYVSLRGVVQYRNMVNGLKELLVDTLVEFTYIPGTVIHLGYSPNFERDRSDIINRFNYDRYRVTNSTIFFKASYLFRF